MSGGSRRVFFLSLRWSKGEAKKKKKSWISTSRSLGMIRWLMATPRPSNERNEDGRETEEERKKSSISNISSSRLAPESQRERQISASDSLQQPMSSATGELGILWLSSLLAPLLPLVWLLACSIPVPGSDGDREKRVLLGRGFGGPVS
ncbi:uncharacterized protein MCYG_01351 [Microsporum canis CBS 113480]|uniref:Uncharacterized protein n=1 Tax=Arthroderma otae (strain ATCC MYA-4605 / CBS 113480) TaxID=554155 RepID=C5FF79_ARTOC|nr:uncharacterized protein MCYG_01351 [Microsporum canis CBS 113480]EEQ28463.1 predicted protein [Microsporum canis CBS 113480]